MNTANNNTERISNPGSHPVAMAGIDYRNAEAGIRAELSFNHSELTEFLGRFRADEPTQELVVLCTCNRTEFYLACSRTAASPPEIPRIDRLMALLRQLRPGARALDQNCFRYRHDGDDVVRHLFRVAAGLESRLLGDGQIPSQVRKALHTAQTAGTAGPALRDLFTAALRAARRVRRETGLSRGSAGIGGAVDRSIVQELGSSERHTALILGAGQAACDIASQLAKTGRYSLTLSARRIEQARLVAARVGASVADWKDVTDLFTSTDVIIAATSAKLETLTPERLAAVSRNRRTRLILVDAGVPPNAETSCGKVEGLTLVGLDQLAREQGQARVERETHIPAAQTVLEAEYDRWSNRRYLLEVEPAIKHLYVEAAQIRAEILSSAGGHDIDTVTRRLVQRLLHGPVCRLRQAALRPSVTSVAEVASRVFATPRNSDRVPTEN